MEKRRYLFLLLALIAAVAMFVSRTGLLNKARTGRAPDRPADITRQARVERVVDGDSIVLAGGERVRYLGIDTPEHGEPCFEEAAALNRRLVAGKTVTLHVCPDRPIDKYGRTRAFIRLPSPSSPDSGLFVNAELVRQGLARTRFLTPCEHEVAESFVELEIEAWRSGKGIRSACANQASAEGAAQDSTSETLRAEEARNHIGEIRTVRGRVRLVSEGKGIVFLSFGTGKNPDLTAVIFPRGRHKFEAAGIEALRAYTGMMVDLVGRIDMYRGRPEVVLEGPGQIRVVE